MTMFRRFQRDERGVASIEMAFALPILIVMIWMFVQFAQIYRALSGIQHGLGEGARYATLCLSPSNTGCSTPPPIDDIGSVRSIKNTIQDRVYGIGPGTFTIADPVRGGTPGTGIYYDLKVSYSQPTDLLLARGPTVNVSRSKRVWVAGV